MNDDFDFNNEYSSFGFNNKAFFFDAFAISLRLARLGKHYPNISSFVLDTVSENPTFTYRMLMNMSDNDIITLYKTWAADQMSQTKLLENYYELCLLNYENLTHEELSNFIIDIYSLKELYLKEQIGSVDELLRLDDLLEKSQELKRSLTTRR